MRSKFWRLMLLSMLFLSACAEKTSPASGPIEVPPTPYPDTPSPAQLNAPKVDAPAILHLDMFSELNGWALTDAEVVRTNDGGISWYDFTPAGLEEAGYSVDAFFTDSEHAWIQKPDLENFPNRGTLYRTTDGGNSWENFTVPFSRGDLGFVDAQNGWALADLGVGAGSNAVAVFQTRDGGASWEKMYTNDPNESNAADSLPLGGIKSDIVPLDMETAWISGVVYAPGEVYLYRTQDRGRSWSKVAIPLPPGGESAELGIDRDQMKLVSPADGFLALRMSGNSMQTAVYVTHDGGRTWNLTPTILDGVGASSFLAAQEAVIYNGQQFNVTRDGAQTWVSVPPDISFGETFVDMEFVNPLSGWVITMDPSNQRSLYRTHDGGSTWLPVVP